MPRRSSRAVPAGGSSLAKISGPGLVIASAVADRDTLPNVSEALAIHIIWAARSTPGRSPHATRCITASGLPPLPKQHRRFWGTSLCACPASRSSAYQASGYPMLRNTEGYKKGAAMTKILVRRCDGQSAVRAGLRGDPETHGHRPGGPVHCHRSSSRTDVFAHRPPVRLEPTTTSSRP